MASPARRVRLGLALLLLVTAVATVWYWIVEDFGFVAGLYQTVMTVTTVGFKEVRPLGTRGQLFTVGLMVVGVGVALYTLVSLVEDFVERGFFTWGRWRMDRRIERMRGHVVLCGFGRVGATVAELVARDHPLVVVDNDVARLQLAHGTAYRTVDGEATEDEVLRRAGVERAAVVIVSLHSDADAISTVLSARALNGDARIVARANAAGSVDKLRRAGADQVVNPLDIGARRLATFAVQPTVADFLELHDGAVEYRIEEVEVPEGSPAAGRALRDLALRERTGALVLALRRPGGRFESNPGAEAIVGGGTILVVIGTPDQLEGLDALLGEARPASTPRTR